MLKELYIGKNLEEIKEKAITTFDLAEEELLFIEKDNKKAIFNKKIEVEVIKKADLDKYIKEYILKLFDNMGIKANIEIKRRDEMTIFNIISEKNSILIGKNGRTIEAFQIFLNQAIKQEIKGYYHFIIDVNDYKSQKQKRMEQMAIYAAKDVAKTKIDLKLDPMNAYERRIIHNILTDIAGIITISEGEEPNRYIIIKAKEDK